MTTTLKPGFEHQINLANARLGSTVISVTDDWFAAVDRMLQPENPVWKEGLFDENGKWMDGWESRRKRCEGYDHAVIRLGVPGVISGIDIDTSFFTGNYPPSASLEACFCADGDPEENSHWHEILPATPLQGDSHHLYAIDDVRPWSHLRFNIYPDGGVARLRVYGTPYHDWSKQCHDTELDLAAAINGGRTLACNDEHFGKMANILNPGRADNMADGWETARRRTPGNDWVIVALGHPGEIKRIVVDTLHFKGNYPDRCSIQAVYINSGNEAQIEHSTEKSAERFVERPAEMFVERPAEMFVERPAEMFVERPAEGSIEKPIEHSIESPAEGSIENQSLSWQELLPSQKLEMHQEHEFIEQIHNLGAITHVRLNIFPDGGISRLRLFGRISPS